MKNYILVNPLKERREGLDLGDEATQKAYDQAQDPKPEPKPKKEPDTTPPPAPPKPIDPTSPTVGEVVASFLTETLFPFYGVSDATMLKTAERAITGDAARDMKIPLTDIDISANAIENIVNAFQTNYAAIVDPEVEFEFGPQTEGGRKLAAGIATATFATIRAYQVWQLLKGFDLVRSMAFGAGLDSKQVVNALKSYSGNTGMAARNRFRDSVKATIANLGRTSGKVATSFLQGAWVPLIQLIYREAIKSKALGSENMLVNLIAPKDSKEMYEKAIRSILQAKGVGKYGAFLSSSEVESFTLDDLQKKDDSNKRQIAAVQRLLEKQEKDLKAEQSSKSPRKKRIKSLNQDILDSKKELKDMTDFQSFLSSVGSDMQTAQAKVDKELIEKTSEVTEDLIDKIEKELPEKAPKLNTAADLNDIPYAEEVNYVLKQQAFELEDALPEPPKQGASVDDWYKKQKEAYAKKYKTNPKIEIAQQKYLNLQYKSFKKNPQLWDDFKKKGNFDTMMKAAASEVSSSKRNLDALSTRSRKGTGGKPRRTPKLRLPESAGFVISEQKITLEDIPVDVLNDVYSQVYAISRAQTLKDLKDLRAKLRSATKKVVSGGMSSPEAPMSIDPDSQTQTPANESKIKITKSKLIDLIFEQVKKQTHTVDVTKDQLVALVAQEAFKQINRKK
jgi:hypothetical protein